jgi:hypothetical protein
MLRRTLVTLGVVGEVARGRPMSSMRNPRRPYLPAVRTPLEAAYWGSAILCGLILALDPLAWPIDFFVLVAIGIAATIVGRRVEGSAANHRSTSWLWVGIFLVVWLTIALVRQSFPFGP